ncbi:enoyl-CoA hydratase/isomerase family protein [Candidimonas humi]|uniref:Enoyl-CoA hydratase-related protein n=1 Tax=Candidimonas humi TaxID=683355 RepID=A0ABV8NY84_9BURK|nr:enoyl-CoA hydratase-related protein [Candidimonas humi]MBV6304799.1 enoyl-CoA hydratase/isomerase family protein [Candidimonas humi]
MTAHILTERFGDTLHIILNRPDKRNAIDMPMFSRLASTLADADREPMVGAVLLSGAGEVFCAGHDLHAFSNWPQQPDGPVPAFLHALAALQKPLVVAVQGHAVGIGATLLLHADWVISTSDAQLHLPFIDMEIAPEAASSLLLAQAVGLGRARRIMLSGAAFSGQQAHDWGLVTEICDQETLHALARERVEYFAAKSGSAYARIKRLLTSPYDVHRRIDEEVDAINLAVLRQRGTT